MCIRDRAISDLKLLFQTADLVKFAKHDPQMNENDANLINAIDFINETKQPEGEDVFDAPAFGSDLYVGVELVA